MTFAHLANRMLTGFARVGNRQANGHLIEVTTTKTDGTPLARPRPEAACALGALALGFGVKPAQLLANNLTWWPATEPDPIVRYPGIMGPSTYMPLHKAIYTLNDADNWSVERIAKWLEDGPTLRPDT